MGSAFRDKLIGNNGVMKSIINTQMGHLVFGLKTSSEREMLLLISLRNSCSFQPVTLHEKRLSPIIQDWSTSELRVHDMLYVAVIQSSSYRSHACFQSTGTLVRIERTPGSRRKPAPQRCCRNVRESSVISSNLKPLDLIK